MDRALYIAMGAAREAMTAQAVTSHNLANASTVGFKADLALAKSVRVTGPGYPDRTHIQQGSAAAPDLTPGAVVATGRDLDIAIQGQGFLVIQAPDGSDAFSRNGNLRVDVNGLLTDSSGNPVKGESGPIALPPFEHLDIGVDGTLSIRSLGQAAGAPTVVDRILLANPDPANLVKMPSGLIQNVDRSPAAGDISVKLVSASLEMSNVEPITAMVELIELQRQFETHIRMMSTVEEIDTAANRLLRLR